MLKVLGQSRPAVETNTDVYTCPAGTGTVVSTISVCNTDEAMAFFSVAVRPAAATLDDKHWVFKDIPISGLDTFAATCGFTLNATDVVTVASTTGQVSFSLFGQEVPQ